MNQNRTRREEISLQIYVVSPGDTLTSIANQYKTTPENIIAVNELPNPEQLVVGQSLAIRIPSMVYTVQEGDTLESISKKYGVSVAKIQQNNPQITLLPYLVAGETIILFFEGEQPIDSIVVNGFAYPNIREEVLRKTLPFLTYITIFAYHFLPDGTLLPLNDEPIIKLAKEQGVAPVMMLVPMNATDTSFNSDLASELFKNEEAENRLIENVVANMKEKGYEGLNIDFEYIYPVDRERLINFIQKTRDRLTQEGFFTVVALAPKTSGEMQGLLYEAHDYPAIGKVTDDVLFMTYEWGYLYGPPMATSPLDRVKRVVDYGVSVIDPDKILLGVPNYAYDWILPFVKGESRAETISNQEAIERAAKYRVSITFDEQSQSPYYFYTDEKNQIRVVWFDDVRSMDAKLRLIPEYGLAGAGVWQIMDYFPGLWNVVGALFVVEKV